MDDRYAGGEADGDSEQTGGNIARVAQSVEHTLGKGEVTGSIPVASLMAMRGARVVIWDHRHAKRENTIDESE